MIHAKAWTPAHTPTLERIRHQRLFDFVALCALMAALTREVIAEGGMIMKEERAVMEKLLTEPDYVVEGFVEYRHRGQTYKLWYGRIGSGSALPALVLHGGPGGNHHNLVAFQGSADERPAIFYDPLGCGKSDRPDDASLWRADRYFAEVRGVRDGLGLREHHLIGHSWGTTVAVGFAAEYSEGILSISLRSPVPSFPYFINKVAPALKQDLRGLNGKAGQVIDDFELRGQGSKSDYDEACMEFTKKHVTHSWPLPEAMKKSIAARNAAVHDVMVTSGSELNLPGNLRAVNVTSRLSKLDIPALMTWGSDDLCTPAYTKWQSGFARHARYQVIPGSAHMTPVDNPLEQVMVQRAFLREVESAAKIRVRGKR